MPTATDRRQDLNLILRAALAAVDPAAAVRRALSAADLAAAERVWIVGAGKAGVAMARAATEVVGGRLAGGVMAVPGQPDTPTPGITFIAGGHPLPTEGSVRAGGAVADLLGRTRPGDLVLALISGGGSALLELPEPGVSLADLQQLTDLALRAGAPIESLNRMRWRLSQLKGGGLLRLAAPARVLGLVLSDVIGNPLEIIASGPTVMPTLAGPTGWEVAERLGFAADLPATVGARLRGAPLDIEHASVENRIIGSNKLAGEAALVAAARRGYTPVYLGDTWQGEAWETGRSFARELLSARGPQPICVVAGGETTVRVRGHGRGGRNQEFALAAAIEIAGQPDMWVASFGTDGIDGPTDAAGAIVTGDTVARAKDLGLDPQAFLADNDTYRFHKALNCLIQTGPTGTNVNDLMIGLLGPVVR